MLQFIYTHINYPEADPCYNVYILLSNPEADACYKLNILKTLELTLVTKYILTTLKLTLVTMYRFSYQTLRLTLLTNVIFKNPGTDAYTKYILTTLKLTLSYLLTLLLGYLLTWETKLSCNALSQLPSPMKALFCFF